MRRWLLPGFAALIAPTLPVAAAPKVVVSIMPLHGIVAGVMDGVGTPYLLLKGNISPHAFSLRPSQARRLRNAHIIFWIGPVFETSLARPVRVLGKSARVVAMMDLPGMRLLRTRHGGLWGKHGHRHGHGHSVVGKNPHKTARHLPGQTDGHMWLDPRNGLVMAREIARILSLADPPNAPRYQANLNTVLARIAIADKRAAESLAPVKGRPFIVFHDAYQYFEKRYGLAGRGAATLEGRSPGARRISRIRHEIRNRPISCVLTEPQYSARLARMLADGTAAKVGTIDPLGSALKAGKGAYARLILSVAASVARCLR